MKLNGESMKSWATLIWLVAFMGLANAQFGKGPPRYSMDRLPQTKFTCEGKLTSRYYADQETDCQMFHVCTKMSSKDISNFKFLCPNGTVFDQEHQVCADYYQVVCLANIGTNPLGQIFELYKLNSKESTNRQEFGEAPIQDPDYIGQNSLGGGEDFQAEEYNNNKLAASQNSLPFQTYEKPNSQNIFYQSVVSTTTNRPTTTEQQTPTTTFRTRIRPTTTPQPVPVYRTTTTEEDPDIDFSDFQALSKYQEQFHRGFKQRPNKLPSTTEQPSYTSTTYAPFVEYSTEQQRYVETDAPSTTQPPTFTPIRRVTRPPTTSTTELDTDIDFSDFNALSKFQNSFHRSFTPAPTASSEIEEYREPEKFVNSNVKPVLIKGSKIATTKLPTTIASTRFPISARQQVKLEEDDPKFDYTQVFTTYQPEYQKDVAELQTTRVTFPPTTTITTTQRSTQGTRTTIAQEQPDPDNFDFSDFSSLSKFQNSFHKVGFTERSSSTAKPATLFNQVQIILTKTSGKPEPITTTKQPYVINSESEEFINQNDFSTALSKFRKDFDKSPIPTVAKPAQQEFHEIPRQTQKPIIVAFPTTIRSTRTTQPPPSPATSQEDGEFQFNDFLSLSKFQNSFHRTFTPTPTGSSGRTDEPEQIPNHGFSDFNTKPHSETEAPFSFQQQSTTTRRPIPVYQSTFRTTFSQATTAPTPTFQQQPSRFGDDFFIRQPSSSSQSRGQFSDEDESGKPIKFSSPIYEGPESKPKSLKKSNPFENFETEVETFNSRSKYTEPTSFSSADTYNENQELVVSSPRPIRRGRKRLHVIARDKNLEQQYEPQYKYSRRVENARFEDRERFAVKEKTEVKTDEIFNAEASVFRGPARHNLFYERPAPQTQSTEAPIREVTKAAVEENKAATTTNERETFGRRVRPFRHREREELKVESDPETEIQDVQDSSEVKKSGKTRVVKRLRQKPTGETIPTTSTQPEVSTTSTIPSRQPSRVRTKTITRRIGSTEITSAPIPHRDRPTTSLITTSTTSTTPEPQLITASDEEVERIRNKNVGRIHVSVITEKSTSTKTIPIISKKVKFDDSKSTKADYDYTYYDTERDNDYSDISFNFGIKPGKTVVKN